MSLYDEYDSEKFRGAGARLLPRAVETARHVGERIAEHLEQHFGKTPRRPQLAADIGESKSNPARDTDKT